VHAILHGFLPFPPTPNPTPAPAPTNRSIIYYPSEELEELDLDEIARDGHMMLLPQGGLQ